MCTVLPEGFILKAASNPLTFMKAEGTGEVEMKEKITKINRTLFELVVGILIYGVVCQLFVFFVKDKMSYNIGLWIGILTALLSACHMWWTLDRALDLEEKAATKKMSTNNLIRYFVIAVILTLVGVTGVGNILAAFLGIMGLKASAYMHIITKKISTWIYGEEILPPLIEEPADEQEM